MKIEKKLGTPVVNNEVNKQSIDEDIVSKAGRLYRANKGAGIERSEINFDVKTYNTARQYTLLMNKKDTAITKR